MTSAKTTPARRVPQHLSMTLEELVATDNVASTHRLVEHPRESVNAIFDRMNATQVDSIERPSPRRVPQQLSMTLEELVATEQISATHRLVERPTAVSATAKDTSTASTKSTMEDTARPHEAEVAQVFTIMNVADQQALEMAAKDEELNIIKTRRSSDPAPLSCATAAA